MSDNDSRYDDILRRIAQRKREEANAPKQDDLAAILDGVNAWGFLEDLKQSGLKQINCYGPKSLRGYIPISWVGVVVWCKPKGYYHYETLTLLGIWAYEEAGTPHITLGAKALKFSAPIFNPESYYHHLKRRFDLYYTGDGAPPQDSSRLYTIKYEPSERLEIRAAIQRELARWAEAYR
jgi:hypothetical protein